MNEMAIVKKSPIEGLSFDNRIGHYTVSVKVGTYYEFTSFSISNQEHYHDSYELVIVVSGSGAFSYKGGNRTLKKGDIFVSEPYTDHEIHINPIETMIVFYMFFSIESNKSLKNNSCEEILIENFLHAHEQVVYQHTEMIAYLLFMDNYGVKASCRNDLFMVKIVEEFLLNSMARLTKKTPRMAVPKGKYEINIFEKSLDYIDQHIEMKLTAEVIADALGISRRSLYTMFMKNMDRPVHDYIKERKIALSEHYLTMNLSVLEAANMVGIDSQSYFCRLFKKYKGVTPSDYKKSIRPKVQGYGRRLS